MYYESGGCSAQREYNSCSPVSATGDHKKNCRFRTFVSEIGDYNGTVQSNREGRGLSFLKVATKSNVLVHCVNITILLQPVRRVTTTRCDDSTAVSVRSGGYLWVQRRQRLPEFLPLYTNDQKRRLLVHLILETWRWQLKKYQHILQRWTCACSGSEGLKQNSSPLFISKQN